MSLYHFILIWPIIIISAMVAYKHGISVYVAQLGIILGPVDLS